MATGKIFKGFSTLSTSDSRSWALYDIDLIKKDLYVHFHTRKGERVMRPTFGCGIWDIMWDQLTPDIVEEVELECQRIVESDSRVQNRGVYVTSQDHTIVCIIDLYYHAYDIVDQFRLEFEQRQ